MTLRREAHSLVEGKPPDDTDRLAKVRSAMAGLLADRESPTWAFDAALRLEPTKSAHSIALANRLNELGRSAAAERVILAVTEARPDDPRNWLERGTYFATVGQVDRAAADFARALERMPQDFETWGDRAKLCIKMSEHPDAFDRLLELRPTDALLWYIRAERHLLKREYQAAIADFTRRRRAAGHLGVCFCIRRRPLAFRRRIGLPRLRHPPGRPSRRKQRARDAFCARADGDARRKPARGSRSPGASGPTGPSKKRRLSPGTLTSRPLALFRAGDLEAATKSLESLQKTGLECRRTGLERGRHRHARATAAAAARAAMAAFAAARPSSLAPPPRTFRPTS